MDSANKTFFIMVVLTMVCFGITLYQFFNPKEDNETLTAAESIANNERNIKTAESQNNFVLKTKSKPSDTDIIYENSKLKVILDLAKGEISSVLVKASEDNSFDIVSGNGDYNALKLKLGSWKSGIDINTLFDEDFIYAFSNEGNKYTFSCEFSSGESEDEIVYKIEKIYTFFDDENIFHLDVRLSNNKNKAMKFDSSSNVFSLGWGPSLGVNGKINERYDMFKYLSNGKVININSKNKLFKGTNGLASFRKSLKDSWIASDGHYFTSVIIPDGNEYDCFFDYSKSLDNLYYCGFSLISNRSVIDTGFSIYCGPKSGKILKQYDDFKNDTVYLSKTELSKISPPIVWGLGNVLSWCLKVLYSLVKNYGLAIIILTIILKALLSPLMVNSMKSSQKMRSLQPKLSELQTKYKDKPEILNQKTMELYKKAGFNPMAGCLPMLLQMPFLFAMYQLLDRMFELKGASFLWIKDLAMPDALITFNFTIPLLNINSLNILPIVMVISQIFQSLLTPGMESNPQTKMMLWLMPLMFFFFFYNVSSGLVLYWTVMNLLGIIQQLIMNKTLVASPSNDKLLNNVKKKK